MIGVFVTIPLGDLYDAPQLKKIASSSRARFEGVPGLHSKTYLLDPRRREARNLYVWESEEQARAFFTTERLAQITKAYGVEPKLDIVEVAALVMNPP